MKLDDFIIKFAHAMQQKINENMHKGGWNTGDPENDRAFLREKLEEEVDELFDELDAYEHNPDEYVGDGLLREAADVANIAMMLADVCGQLKKA